MPEKKSSSISFKPLNSSFGQSRFSVTAIDRGLTRRKSSWSDVSLIPLGDGEFIDSKGRLVLLNFAWLGIMISMIVLVVAAIPSQVDFLVGSRRKAQCVALVAIVGSCAVFISAPLFGYISDNSKSRFGRRRIFMLGGTVIACLGLLGASLCAPYFSNDKDLLPKLNIHNLTSSIACTVPKPKCPGNATTDAGTSGHGSDAEFGLFTLSVVTFFCGSTILSTALAGLIADKTHPSARGFSSGVVGGMMLTGNLLGAGLGILADRLHVSGTYGVMAVILCFGVTVTCTFTPEMPANASRSQKMSLKDMIYGYGRPFKSHDFRWVVITRFLLQMGLATCVGFLQYWLDDVIRLPACIMPIQAVSILFIPLMIMGAISSTICGIWTDRLKRRKIFVYVAGYGMALSVIGLIFCRSYWVALGLLSLIGIAYGAYVSVDLALVMDVLPDPKEHAKDLAVWHQSMVLPQLIATPIGGFLVQAFQSVSVGSHGKHGCDYGLGYQVVFGVTACYLLASAILVRKIVSVR